MDDERLWDLAERAVAALEDLAPGDPGWWVIAPPIAVFVAALVALGVGLLNYWQKRKADAKAEWWRRVQWALEARAATDNPMLMDSGSAVLNVLAKSNKPSAEERDIIEVVLENSSVEYLDEGSGVAPQTEPEAAGGDAATGDLDEVAETGDNGSTQEVADGSQEDRQDRHG